MTRGPTTTAWKEQKGHSGENSVIIVFSPTIATQGTIRLVPWKPLRRTNEKAIKLTFLHSLPPTTSQGRMETMATNKRHRKRWRHKQRATDRRADAGGMNHRDNPHRPHDTDHCYTVRLLQMPWCQAISITLGRITAIGVSYTLKPGSVLHAIVLDGTGCCNKLNTQCQQGRWSWKQDNSWVSAIILQGFLATTETL